MEYQNSGPSGTLSAKHTLLGSPSIKPGDKTQLNKRADHFLGKHYTTCFNLGTFVKL